MAAYAASAFATTSEAVPLAGKPGVGAARDSGADSPFAAMLAQMAGGTNPQAMSAAYPMPSNDASVTTQASTPLAAREFASSDRFSQTGVAASGLQPAEIWTPQAAWRPQAAASQAAAPSAGRANNPEQDFMSADAASAFRQNSESAAPPSPATRTVSADSFADLLGNGNASRFGAASESANTPHEVVLAQVSTTQPPASATFLAGSSAPQSSAQQAASSWLRQIMGTGTTTNASASLPATMPLASALPGETGPTAQSLAQKVPSWLQQAMAARNPAAASASSSQPQPNLPFGVSSYAQAAGTSPLTAAPQTAAQQSRSPLLQQIIAASAQVGSSTSVASQQNEPAALPLGVASYAQSVQVPAPQFAGASSVAADAQPSHVLQAPSNPAVAASASTILAAGSTQSVAAMFGVQSFPSSMAYAVPGSDKVQAAQADNAPTAPSQSASFATHAARVSSNAAASTTANAPAAPQTAQQAPQQGTPQSFHALTSAIQTPAQAAVADSTKAATLAQAAQSSVRQGHPASSTEAQALPLNFDFSDAKISLGQASANAAGSAASAPDQQATEVTSQAPSSSQATLSALVQHAAPQSPAEPALAAASVNVTQPMLPAEAAAQLPASATAQSPQPAGTLPATPPAAMLASPDLNALAVSIAAKSLTGAQQFDIRMDPAELGRVDVRLSLDGNGTAQAHLAAERPETLTLLQNNAGTLTRALQDSGVQVANNGLQFSLKGQERQGDGQPRASSRGRAPSTSNIAAAGALNGAAPSYGPSPSGSGVNILV